MFPIATKWNPLFVCDLRWHWQRRQLFLKRNLILFLCTRSFSFLAADSELHTLCCLCLFQFPSSQFLSSVTMGGLMAHPLGAVQRIWSPALATAICVCWRSNERKTPAGLSSNPKPLSRACAWTPDNSNLVSAFHTFDLTAPISAHACITLRMMKTG